MNSWNEGISRAIDYIEENLTQKLEISDIAAQAYVSPFYFQKIFSVLCGYSLGEYIRNRRLTLAGQALSSGSARVIDVAYQYGYESLDGFTRAFTRFHGISPSAAREPGAMLRSFAPLKIKLTLEGGTMLEYRIEEKEAISLVGYQRPFSGETSYQEIPKFWEEHMAAGTSIWGKYGVCLDNTPDSFLYLIADDFTEGKQVPDGCVLRNLPAGTWAVFPVRGALPQALQEVNTKIWSEWLPSCRQYQLAGNYNVELYTPDDYYEIWVPVERV